MWFAHGDGPTAADYMMLFPLEALASGQVGDVVGPKVRAWVDTVHSRCSLFLHVSSLYSFAPGRPAYQKALEKGGPYEYA
jgi:glutathione S-transferase